MAAVWDVPACTALVFFWWNVHLFSRLVLVGLNGVLGHLNSLACMVELVGYGDVTANGLMVPD